MNLIAVKNLCSQFGPARDQGARPTCLAFAVSDAHAAVRDNWTPLSCEYAFFHAQRRANLPPTSGAQLSAMLDTLREDGQPEEKDWPYLKALPTPIAAWGPPATVGEIYGRESRTEAPNLDHIIRWLDQDRPVVILTTLSACFYNPTPDGVIDPESNEQPEPKLRHAVIACGHGTIDGRRALLVRNSWGPRWGRDGYGWLTETFLKPRIYNAAILMENVNVSADSAAA